MTAKNDLRTPTPSPEVRAHDPSEAFDRTIAELQRQNDRLQLLQDVAMASNAPIRPSEAFEITLERVCQFTGWPVGHVYLPDQGGLAPADLWHLREPAGFRHLVEVTRTTRFGHGEGLPGRVLASGRPAWIRDVWEDPDFSRSHALPRSEVRGAFAFPILVGEEVVAILEFFSPDVAEPNEPLLDLVANLGAILGRVVERDRAAEELRAAEQWLRQVVETAHEAFISIDEDGLVREWNAEAERLFGWSRDEALGLRLSEMIIPPIHREAHEHGRRHFLDSGEGPVLDQRLELPALHRDGHELPVELTISPLKIGRRFAFNAFLHDISDRKRTEEELRRREQALAEAQALAALGSWEWDLATNRVTWSDQTYRNFGLEPGSIDVDLEKYSEWLHPDDREMVLAEVQRAAEEQRSFAFEHRLVRPDGEVRTLSARGRMVFDDEGRPVKMIGTGHDVTERKEAELQAIDLARTQAAREFAESERARLYRLLMEAPAVVGITRGPDHVFELANHRLLEIVEGHDVLGKPFREAIPEELQGGFGELLDGVFRSGEPFVGLEVPARVQRTRGTYEDAWFNFVYQPIVEESGEVGGILTHAVEVTHEVLARRRVEEKAAELAALAEQLEKSNRDLDQFAYVASHDLKAPLRGIANLSQWLEEDLGDDLSDTAREMMVLLRGRVGRMEAMIEGVLQYSRAGRLGAEPEEVDVGALVGETLELLQPGPRATVETSDLPVLVTERAPLAQVLLNLIGNALKHARREDPIVRVTAEPEGESWRISVADNGPGIEPRYHDRIWTMFQTLSARDELESTGIGLSVVRKVVEDQGERVWVESNPAESPGATFHFTWPARPELGRAADRASASSPGHRGSRG